MRLLPLVFLALAVAFTFANEAPKTADEAPKSVDATKEFERREAPAEETIVIQPVEGDGQQQQAAAGPAESGV